MGGRNAWTNSSPAIPKGKNIREHNAKKRRRVQVKTNDSPGKPPRCNLIVKKMTRGLLHRLVELARLLGTWRELRSSNALVTQFLAGRRIHNQFISE